jgi:hypothetical protein
MQGGETKYALLHWPAPLRFLVLRMRLPAPAFSAAADAFAINAVELEPGTTIPRGGSLLLTMSGTNQQQVTGELDKQALSARLGHLARMC